MLSYFVRRLLLGCLTLLFITFLVYGLIRSMPGDPLLMQLQSATPDKMPSNADIERMRKTFGLDKPWYTATQSPAPYPVREPWAICPVISAHRPILPSTPGIWPRSIVQLL